jgi:amino acid adenylation domain-containing protein
MSGAFENHAGDSRFDQSLPACFERAAAANAWRVALDASAQQTTYQELNETANRLAHSFLRRGGPPGDRIAILMQHGSPQIAAALAVLKAGRIVVALNPSNPPARLKQLVGDAEPSCIVTDGANADLAAELARPNCGVVRFESESAEGSTSNPSIAIDPGQTAFLVYTSGSTGQPKGVMQTHRQQVRDAIIFTEAVPYTAADRIAWFGSLSHGQGIGMMWCALLNGAALCPFAVALNGVTGLADWMIENRITSYVSSASIFRSFMKILDDDVRLPLVREVRLTSEPATSDDFKQFQKHFSDTSVFIHTLASSEASYVSISCRSRSDNVSPGRLSIGRITKGHKVLLLDERGDPIGSGEVGEIVVRSRYMAAGYWRNPSLTAERFSDPDDSETRQFRTGDLGRINAEGILEFLGRRDQQIKIRGNRIELSEVEDGLRRLAGVEHAVVEAIERPNHEPALVGYVVTNDNRSWSPARLRSALRAILPDTMIPSTFVLLESLPLTPNGKVDRERLRQFQPRRDQDIVEQPHTTTEVLLAGLWATTFDLPGIGRLDNFFDLGGDSLIAAELAARIHGALGIEINVGMFVQHPTLAEFAAAVDAIGRAPGMDDGPEPVRVPRTGPLPMSFFQERIWKLSQTPQASRAYTMAIAHRIVGPLDAEMLRDCLDYFSKRHELLRTTFATVDGRPVQIVHPPAPASLRVVDLTRASDPEQQAMRLYRNEAVRIFDLGKLPLMNFTLLRLHENEHWLVHSNHHIITDRWSWTLLIDELALLYAARRKGASRPLPDIEPLQYADYAAWQRKALRPDQPAYKETVQWWKAQFSTKACTRQLPFKRRRVTRGVDPAEGYINWGLDQTISRQLGNLAREAGATPHMVSLAAFAALLAADTGSSDVVIGTYVTNRNRAEFRKMFGMFSNLVTLRFRCEPKLSFRAWLSDVRKASIEIEPRCYIPVQELRSELRSHGVTLPEIPVIFLQATPYPVVGLGVLAL